jgi:four helix bundle protein
MTEKQDRAWYDLEETTLAPSRQTLTFCKELSRAVTDTLITKQPFRAATSDGPNYIETNEALGKKDFLMSIRTCRKEAKGTGYWLKLVEPTSPDLRTEESQSLSRGTFPRLSRGTFR